jgi:hypothetical protein
MARRFRPRSTAFAALSFSLRASSSCIGVLGTDLQVRHAPDSAARIAKAYAARVGLDAARMRCVLLLTLLLSGCSTDQRTARRQVSCMMMEE